MPNNHTRMRRSRDCKRLDHLSLCFCYILLWCAVMRQIVFHVRWCGLLKSRNFLGRLSNIAGPSGQL